MPLVMRLPLDKQREARFELSRKPRVRNLVVPEQPVEELFQGFIDVRLPSLTSNDGNTTLLEQIIIIGLSQRMSARRIFEFGTFDGSTSASLSVNLGEDAEILTIDLPASDATSAKLSISKADMKHIMKDESGSKSRKFTNVVQLYGDTATFDFSPWYMTRDLIFIDACHEYAYVKNDTEVALRLLKPGGTIIWHDYSTWVGVTEALNHFYRNDTRFKALKWVSRTSVCYLHKVGL